MTLDARDRAIESFTHQPDVRVFLMSLKAGGVALNLTAASHVSGRGDLLCFMEKHCSAAFQCWIVAACQCNAKIT